MDHSVSYRKKMLRKTFLRVRRSLSCEESDVLSKKIMDRLVTQSCFKNAQTVHIYVSMDNNREVSTRQLIKLSLRNGKNVIVPKMEAQGILSHHRIESPDELKPNRWGVPEPVVLNPIDIKEIQLVIVPMVAADFEKNRLGYGKGYYDRFLQKIDAHKTGLCYNCTLSWPTLPTDHYDQSMNDIVTESKVL